jgi:hypothetical protein
VVNVTEVPTQTVSGAVKVIVGVGTTVTVCLIVSAAQIPATITVYVEVVKGDTVIVEVVAPLLHL